MNRFQGLTLLELLITVAIITLVLTLGVPAVITAQKNLQLKGVAEVSYFAFQQARSFAISKRKDVSLVLNPAVPWCLAISEQVPCDCHIALDCQIDGIEQRISGNDFKLIQLQEIKFGNDSMAVFDGVRGLSIGHAGSAVFSDGVNQLKVILSNMGRVRICVKSGNLGSYESC